MSLFGCSERLLVSFKLFKPDLARVDSASLWLDKALGDSGRVVERF